MTMNKIILIFQAYVRISNRSLMLYRLKRGMAGSPTNGGFGHD